MHQSKVDAPTREGSTFSPQTSGLDIDSFSSQPGATSFASPEAQAQRTSELLGAGSMVVYIGPPSRLFRGRLCEYLDDAIERALASRGAPSPYLAAWSNMPDDVEARLADQLFRARTTRATS